MPALKTRWSKRGKGAFVLVDRNGGKVLATVEKQGHGWSVAAHVGTAVELAGPYGCIEIARLSAKQRVERAHV